MKKSLLLFVGLFAVAFGALAQTKTFTDQLVVTINEESSEPQETVIYVEELEDGTCNLSLNNFCLESDGEVLGVGNIALTGVTLTEEGGVKKIATEQTIQIAAGDLDGIGADEWLGPMLGDVPVVLKGEYNAEKLYCTIDIDMMSSLEQIIKVVFGAELPKVVEPAGQKYTDQLVVTINEESTEPQETVIYVEELEDGTCNLSLNNFCLESDGEVLGVGNIALTGVTLTEEGGVKKIATEQTIQIAAGDLDGIGADEWLGPMLGDVPVVLKGEYNAEELYCTIDIDMMSSLGQIIEVVFGNAQSVGLSQVSGADGETLMNVYTLSGICVRKAVPVASALNGLPTGIYVVNGKVIKK